MNLAPEQRDTAAGFYDSKEALRYNTCHQTQQLQRELTQAALQLLHLPVGPPHNPATSSVSRSAGIDQCVSPQGRPSLLLDLGCGSGMSGRTLTETGHCWVGCDISSHMLSLAQGEADPCSPSQAAPILPHSTQLASLGPAPPLLSSRTGHNTINHNRAGPQGTSTKSAHGRGLLFQSDLTQGLPIRPSSLDGAVSISAVQWLCHLPDPQIALDRLFRDLYRCLKAGCKAVLQVYLAGEVKPGCNAHTCCKHAGVKKQIHMARVLSWLHTYASQSQAQHESRRGSLQWSSVIGEIVPSRLGNTSKIPKLDVLIAGNSHVDLMLKSAVEQGFSGGLYVDFPHKGLAKKYFLCLLKGNSSCQGQIWSQACPLALPLHCKLPSYVLFTHYLCTCGLFVASA